MKKESAISEDLATIDKFQGLHPSNFINFIPYYDDPVEDLKDLTPVNEFQELHSPNFIDCAPCSYGPAEVKALAATTQEFNYLTCLTERPNCYQILSTHLTYIGWKLLQSFATPSRNFVIRPLNDLLCYSIFTKERMSANQAGKNDFEKPSLHRS